MSSIVEFWRRCNGPIHPDDQSLLDNAPGVFNLDYPPPAYIGDIESAPIVLLSGNGGYDAQMTPAEYPTSDARTRAIQRLHNPGPVEPADVSPYYARRNYAKWILSGQLALVNAVAYRSVNITPKVRRIASVLPSSKAHRYWLQHEAILSAKSGERLIVAHRYAMWGLKRLECPAWVHFTSAAISPDLPNATIQIIGNFLSH